MPARKTGSTGGSKSNRVTFDVSTKSRPKFDEPLVAFAFDGQGRLLERQAVKSGKLTLGLAKDEVAKARLFLAPLAQSGDEEVSLARLERARAFEAILKPGPDADLIEVIEIPGTVIDWWPFCFCFVRGKVLRTQDSRAVCGARVHICEVDRIWWWIERLPDPDIFRLRNDLIEVLRNPPIPRPGPIPDPPPPPLSDPMGPRPGPGPDPLLLRPLFRAEVPGSLERRPMAVGESLSARPSLFQGGPQPEPPTLELRRLDVALTSRLLSPSARVVRDALLQNWKIIVPWLCYWPWWWWRFRCDEVAVVTTDGYGRFSATVWYPCGGDRPDLYFWVEYDLGSGFETVHHPPIACNTHWDYACGTEVTIRVSDPRVPACSDEPDLPGCQVIVKSIGVGVAVREVQTDAVGPAAEGLTTDGAPFGGTLEPRVDYSRTELIDNRNVPYYRWSYRRLSGPNGVDPDVGPWTIMTRDVYRHYKVGPSYPSDLMGPMPTSGPGLTAPVPNLFRIRPADPPAGEEWSVLNEHVDLATAYFETTLLPGTPSSGPSASGPAPDDLAAGRYELKLELFDGAGNKVNWTAKNIELRITQQDAPFGEGLVTTVEPPAYNKILVGGALWGFRTVVRVDNNYCYAEVLPVAGDVPPDPNCGFHEYGALTDDARLRFVARHPHRFATYGFSTVRASGPQIPQASTSGVAGAPDGNGFSVSGFQYEKDVSVGTLLHQATSPGVTPCAQAAFSEALSVNPMAQNGYSTLTGYRHTDHAAFALATPCECEEDTD
jgi:hypothetical protein